jgi:hypothetical protein
MQGNMEEMHLPILKPEATIQNTVKFPLASNDPYGQADAIGEKTIYWKREIPDGKLCDRK